MLETVILLHRQEAADRLRVSVCTVKRWGAAGLLDERRVGPKLVKITEASVAALMATRKDAARQAGNARLLRELDEATRVAA
jgi:predicted site-specific integrase-resolvase